MSHSLLLSLLCTGYFVLNGIGPAVFRYSKVSQILLWLWQWNLTKQTNVSNYQTIRNTLLNEQCMVVIFICSSFISIGLTNSKGVRKWLDFPNENWPTKLWTGLDILNKYVMHRMFYFEWYCRRTSIFLIRTCAK